MHGKYGLGVCCIRRRLSRNRDTEPSGGRLYREQLTLPRGIQERPVGREQLAQRVHELSRERA